MLVEARIINIEGFIEKVIVVDSEDSQEDNVITLRPPNGLYKARWFDGAWIEGKTEDEFLEDGFLSALQPSQDEVKKAEREIEIVNLLIDLEVI
ncbi:hypothetical protein ACIQXF_04705 [Lysinibacillus sp. NPDC097231]|uniref:hypothetical protein n=1 Tax=Lysinibacillus sp. NPDC097231 TaxID=3364142 RepID=UPI003816C388